MTAALNTTLIVGEDRTLVLDLKTSDGLNPLAVTGWALELRLGAYEVQLVKDLTVVDGAAGRVSCTFEPGELGVVTGEPRYSIWRVDPGAVRLLQDGPATIRQVW